MMTRYARWRARTARHPGVRAYWVRWLWWDAKTVVDQPWTSAPTHDNGGATWDNEGAKTNGPETVRQHHVSQGLTPDKEGL